MIEIKHILKYLEQDASARLKKSVEDWLAESAGNKDDFARTQVLWEESKLCGDYVQYDVEKEWSDFLSEVQTEKKTNTISRIGVEKSEESTLKPIVQKKEETKSESAKIVPISEGRNWGNILSIAASFAILVAATWFLWPQSEYIDIVDSDIDQEIMLDDGSLVQISRGASLKTLRSYKYATERNAQISGEVNFDVASDVNKPFIVETAETAVRVLGTKFNVIASEVESEVANEEGRVKFYVIEDETQYKDLNPGDRIKYDGTGFIDLNEPEPEPEPVRIIPKVEDIINYLKRISNGGVTFGSGINENRLSDLDIDYEGKSVQEVIRLMRASGAIVVALSNNMGCPSCIQIVEIKVPRK